MPDTQTSDPASISTQIGGALAAVWDRYIGERPSGAEVEIKGNTIRWHVPGGTEAYKKVMVDDPEVVEGEETPSGPVRTTAGFARETALAVRTVTSRTVRARMSKHDEKTGDVTETFILEEPRVRN